MRGSGGKDMGNWSELPTDLLSAIARRIAAAADRVRFSGVCRNWLSLAKSEINYLPCNLPWLMLAEKPDSDVRSFVGPDGKESFDIDLPEARGSRCVGSTGCWLVMVKAACHMYILNPFSRAMIDLPPFPEFDDFVNHPEVNILDLRNVVLKVILSFPKSQSPEKEDFIAVAIFDPSVQKLAYMKKGAESWQTIEPFHNPFVHDVIFYQDKLYTVSKSGKIVEFNIHCNPNEKPNTVSNSDLKKRDTFLHQRYLVEFQGQLLQVLKFLNMDIFLDYETVGFLVFKLDFTTGGWVKLDDLGQHSIFLGFNTSVALLATSSSTFKPNRIYFTDDYLVFDDDGRLIDSGDMGVFDLAESFIVPHYTGPCSISSSRPVWFVQPSLTQNQ